MSSEPTVVSTDGLLRAVADEKRRTILRYLIAQPVRWVSVGELADVLGPVEPTRPGESNGNIELHHVTLPHLDRAGLVEYHRNRGVRYRGSEPAEQLLRCLEWLDTADH